MGILIKNISDIEYHVKRTDSIGSSMLREFRLDRYMFYKKYVKKEATYQAEEPSNSLQLGSAIHHLLLKPSSINEDIFILEPNKRYQKAVKEHPSKVVVRRAIFDEATKIVDAVKEREGFSFWYNNFFLPEEENEWAYFWEDPITKLPLKVKFDSLKTAVDGTPILCDLKTTGFESSPSMFWRTFVKWDNGYQVALYRSGLRDFLGDPTANVNVLFFVLDKSKRMLVPFQVPNDLIDEYEQVLFDQFQELRYCYDLDDWKSNPIETQINQLIVPNFARP